MTPNEESLRSAFPSLQQEQIFFDNAGGSQVLGTVISSISDYLSKYNVQLDASYAMGQKATAKFDNAHDICAKFINAHRDEIVLGSSTTQLLRNLSSALKLKQGDEIIVSAVDHEANIAPWVDLAEQRGLHLKWWKPNHSTNPKLLAGDLEALLSPKTRLVTCTHASNILGTITDIKSIAKAAHGVGALVCVDGVGYAAHRPIDVKDLGIDFYCFSWYKVYGPHISMLYASRAAQHYVRSLGHFFNSHAGLTAKLGLAGASYELTQSLPHVVEYLGPPGSPKWRAIIAQEERLQNTLIDYLRSRRDVTIYGEPTGDSTVRLSTVSFTAQGWNCHKLVKAIERGTNYGLRSGCNYAVRLVWEILGRGQDGVVRVSMLHYNTVDEVTGFIKALDRVLSANPQAKL
ncbi:pyridoxal phosphate-dependent transferase [Biscogniauxia marginata]|nr:pyridoxal phosphate-dependent transferase [Biscogniauxia marginata]